MPKDVFRQTKGKKADEAMLLSDQIGFKAKSITRDKEDHSIMIKGLIHWNMKQIQTCANLTK